MSDDMTFEEWMEQNAVDEYGKLMEQDPTWYKLYLAELEPQPQPIEIIIDRAALIACVDTHLNRTDTVVLNTDKGLVAYEYNDEDVLTRMDKREIVGKQWLKVAKPYDGGLVGRNEDV